MTEKCSTTIDRACPLCGSAADSREFAKAAISHAKLDQFAYASRKMPEYMHHRLVLCAACDLLYASPAPAREALEQEYSAAAYDSGTEARYAARTYARLLARVVARIPDRRGALDIGAGDGAFLQELVRHGFTDICGAEPSAAPIAAADEAIRPLLRHAPFQASDYSDRQFSLITCFQTMEHVPDPLALCRDALSLLKPGGAMICVVHNRLALSARILGKRSPIFDIEHLQLFSRNSGIGLLARAGFRDVFAQMVVNRYPLSYWARLFPFPRGLKKGLITGLNGVGVGRIPLPLPAGNLALYGFAGH